jgi:hypothetical protein
MESLRTLSRSIQELVKLKVGCKDLGLKLAGYPVFANILWHIHDVAQQDLRQIGQLFTFASFWRAFSRQRQNCLLDTRRKPFGTITQR